MTRLLASIGAFLLCLGGTPAAAQQPAGQESSPRPLLLVRPSPQALVPGWPLVVEVEVVHSRYEPAGSSRDKDIVLAPGWHRFIRLDAWRRPKDSLRGKPHPPLLGLPFQAAASSSERLVVRPDPAALEALAAELGTNVTGGGTAPQVLVAEDEAASAMSLQICFMAEGLCMRRARTRAEAERLVAAGVQAVVLSSQLPDGECLSLVRALRKSRATARLPIFLLAAKDDSSRIAAGLEAGADDVLMRPLNVEVLMARLRHSLVRQQARYQASAS